MKPDPQTGRLIAALLDNPDQPDGELTGPDGRIYHKRSAPEPGVRTTLDMAGPGQPTARVLTIFEPQSDRPAAYPAELPFVSGVVAMVNHTLGTIPPAAMVIWPEPHDAGALERELTRLSRADGWAVTAEPVPFLADLATPRELRRGEERRLVSRLPGRGAEGGGIMLVQS